MESVFFEFSKRFSIFEEECAKGIVWLVIGFNYIRIYRLWERF